MSHFMELVPIEMFFFDGVGILEDVGNFLISGTPPKMYTLSKNLSDLRC